jgi:hypothetical protein
VQVHELGVEVTVAGPVTNMAELEDSVTRLLSKLRGSTRL